jgi:hypothetical protein
VANRFRHLVETEDHDENDEQKGDPERTVAGMESAKNKTKQESYRPLPVSQFAEREMPAAWSACVCSLKPERM